MLATGTNFPVIEDEQRRPPQPVDEPLQSRRRQKDAITLAKAQAKRERKAKKRVGKP
jgi:hypothetical protein